MEEALDHLSPEERAERLNQWAQERAERLRMENAQYLELRRPLRYHDVLKRGPWKKKIPRDGKDGKGNSQSY